MSSFNIYDNYNSFDDLFNRAEFLEEKDFKSMVKGSKLADIVSKYGEKEAGLDEYGKPVSPIGTKSRVKNLVNIIAMLEMDIIDQKLFNALFRKSPSSTDINKLIKELAPDVYKELFEGDSPKSKDVVEYIEKDRDKKVQFAVINHMNKNKEYVRFDEVDVEKAKEQITDEIEDDVDMEVKIAKGLIGKDGTFNSKEIDAKISELDFDDVDVNIERLDNKEEVAAKIVQLINTKKDLKAVPTSIGLNIEGPIGIFGSETGISDMLTKIITSHFPAAKESEINVRLNTNNRVEEDYEEGPEPMEPEGPTNEYEEGINEVEDEDNEFDPDEAHHYPGYDPNRPLTAEQEKRRQEVNAEFKEFLKKEFPGSAIEDNEFDDFDIGPQSDENVPDDYEEVLKAMVTKDKEQFAKNMIEDEEGGFTKARVLVAFAPEHSPEEMQANVDRYLAAAKKLGVKAKAGKIDDEVAEVYVDAGPASKEMKLLNDLQRDMLQATGYFGGDKAEDGEVSGPGFYAKDIPDDVAGKIAKQQADDAEHAAMNKRQEKYRKELRSVNEERINEAIEMQPHLEVSETSTAAYLTEQKQSDKRNKKAEVKNQSFKDKYKPKTHWQLEELRRYGL